jgi:hypothetical protein
LLPGFSPYHSRAPESLHPMASCFTTWTVLPHESIEKAHDNLWWVGGTMPDGKTHRRMTLARMRDGKVVIHNAIALEEPQMTELEAWGTPAVLVVPGSFHRQDARIWKDRYPNMMVVCPAGARKQVEKIVPVQGSYDDAPHDDTVRLRHFAGCADKEGYVEVRSGEEVTFVINDVVCNLPTLKGFMGFLLAPTGQPSVPRATRWLITKDHAALRADLLRLSGTRGLRRVILSHGANLDAEPGAALAAAATTA